MEVTHREDKITHAVIGGGESISMGITDDAMFMHMLSSTLYSDKILAVVRESLCNAWDAHIEAKRVDRPILITLTQEKLTIRDFGLGIHHSQIGPIYGTYGASTKKHDGNQTGGFGLGCKSPFAYVDHFEVVSCHDGIKTVYRMTKSSAELNGKPGIVPLLSVPTDDEGLTMSLDIKDRTDYMRFNGLIQRIVANGEINAELNGNSLPIIEFSQMTHGYVITKTKMLENDSRICLRYGNVIYPLEAHAAYRHDYERAVAVLDSLGSHYGGYTLVLQAAGSTLSITPSRESLSMEEKTTTTVSKLLKKFLHAHHTRFNTECLALIYSTNEDFVRKGKAAQLLRSPTSKNLQENSKYRYDKTHLITDTTQAATAYMSNMYPGAKQVANNDMMHRLVLLAKSGLYDKGLLRSFRSEFRRQQTPAGLHFARTQQWFSRNVLAPLLVPLLQDKEMAKHRLMVYGNTSSTGGWGYSNETTETGRFYPKNMMALLPFLRRLVVLTHSQKGIDNRLMCAGGWDAVHGAKHGFMTYIVPRTPKKVEAARAFFAAQNVVLIDLTLDVEKRQVVQREAAIKKAKVAGYPTLSSARCGDKFEQDYAKMDKAERVEKPLFYTFLYARSAKGASTRDLPNMDRKAAQIICKLWGDQGAVVFSELQAMKLQKQGVPGIVTFVRQQMLELIKRKEIIKYFGVSTNRMKKKMSTDKQHVIDIVEMINDHPKLFEAVKLGVAYPTEHKLLLDLLDDVEWRDDMREVRAAMSNIPLHKKVEVLLSKFEASKALPYLNTEHLEESLKSKKPEVVDYAIKQFLKSLKD